MIRILAAAMPGGWCGMYGGGNIKLTQRKKTETTKLLSFYKNLQSFRNIYFYAFIKITL